VKGEDLMGMWRLRSWTNVGSDGSAVDPLGQPPVGDIFYNREGYMSVEIMAAGRVPYREPDALGAGVERTAVLIWERVGEPAAGGTA
jgi:hypothetical protein